MALELILPRTGPSVDELIEAASAAERSGAWDAALAGYRGALDRIRSGSEASRARAPQLQRWIGRVLYERGDYDQAHEVLQASLVDAQKLGRREDAASALNSMAVVEQLRGNLELAESLYGRASSLADECGHRRLAAMIDQNLGTLANIRGDLGTALVRYQAALERFRRLGDQRTAAFVLNNMGMLHTDVAEWAAAELSFTSAYTLAEGLGDVGIRAKVDVNRAELYLKRQNFEAARECCDRAFKAYSQLGSDTGLGEVHKFFGVLYRETGKTQLAHTQLSLALNLARSCKNPLLEAETESERARLFLLLKQPHQAVQSLNRAQDLFCALDARREILDLRRRLERLESTYVQAAHLAADQASPRTPEVGRRGERVGDLAVRLAEAVGYEELSWVRVGAFLYDLGNRVLPADVREKKGSLTAEEMQLVRRHTEFGEALVKDLEFPAGVLPMVRNHHEHWDGSGYPDGLAGDEIPLCARIICIADVYDALTSERSYRPPLSSAEVLRVMEGDAGRIFDPELLRRFAALIRDEREGAPMGEVRDVV